MSEDTTRPTVFFPPPVQKALAVLVILAILVTNYLVWIQPLVLDWLAGRQEEGSEEPEEETIPPNESQTRQNPPARGSPPGLTS